MVLQHIPMGTNIFTTIPDFKIDSGRGEGPDWTLLIYEVFYKGNVMRKVYEVIGSCLSGSL